MTTRVGPGVSVVVPSLDQARYLSQALDSVLSQAVAVELLVMDGRSRDGTVDVLRAYGDRVQWVSEPDAGQAAAINKGFRRATAPVVAWLNADDSYLPGALAAALSFLDARPDVDAVYGDAQYVDAGGGFLRPYPAEDYEPSRLVRRAVCTIPQPAMFLRRRVVERVGLLDESLSYALDFEYWLRMAAAGLRLHHLPIPLATLRLHAQAKSVRGLAAFAPEIAGIYERLFADGGPPSLRPVAREALSNAHYRASHCLFWAGDHRGARDHALDAWRRRPWHPRRQLLTALGGRAARALLARWRGDPYRAGVRETA